MKEDIKIPLWNKKGDFHLKNLESAQCANYKLNGFQSDTLVHLEQTIEVTRHFKSEDQVIIELMGPYMGIAEFMCTNKYEEYECTKELIKIASDMCNILREAREDAAR